MAAPSTGVTRHKHPDRARTAAGMLLPPLQGKAGILTRTRDEARKFQVHLEDFPEKTPLTQKHAPRARDVPVIAIFVHDVQRAVRGTSIFGINSTFKSNHFLGYTVALNKLDGVYYIDPRPEMTSDERLSEHIRDFQYFLVKDLWSLSSR